MMTDAPDIDLARLGLIGDRRTCALVSDQAEVMWFCPKRFDAPSVFGSLLDPAAGSWAIALSGARPGGRRYRGASAILETHLNGANGPLTVTDFMAAGDHGTGRLCRLLSPSPDSLSVRLDARPEYGQRRPAFRRSGESVIVDGDYWIYASHPLAINGLSIEFEVPKGDVAWAVLAEGPLPPPSRHRLEGWQHATYEYWHALAGRTNYEGLFADHVRDSLRAIHLLTHEPSGGIIAAPTTSLPEVPGGERNYDYRYAWLRDSGMIVSALTRAGSDGTEERKFLDFICSSSGSRHPDGPPLASLANLDRTEPPPERLLPLAGYLNSRPVRVGNAAQSQLQLDALANVLLAAKLIYERFDTREHWDTVQTVAEFLAENWREPEHGLWEEPPLRQYTTGKVTTAVSLEFISAYADRARAVRWRAAAAAVREYVDRHCRTTNGAYAAVAGSDTTDVSAALYPEWAYTAAHTAAMRTTIADVGKNHSGDGILFRRHLEDDDASREGAFLAATFWMAQYWIALGDLRRAETLIRGGLAYANDLGFFSEEVDPVRGRLLGNFPQSFVHAAFIGAVVDFDVACRAHRR